jgi:hypothetical protein
MDANSGRAGSFGCGFSCDSAERQEPLGGRINTDLRRTGFLVEGLRYVVTVAAIRLEFSVG